MSTRLLVTVIMSLLLSAGSAFAQSRDPYFATFGANYDFFYHQQDRTSGVGAHLDLASTIKRDVPFLSLVGEAGFNHFDEATIASFLGGPRLRLPNAGPYLLPFAQLLVGVQHCGACDSNDFALQGGVGLDVKLAGTNNVRLRFQLDVRHVFADPEGFNPVRASAGIVLPLNR